MTVAAFPVIEPAMALLKVLVPAMVWFVEVITAPAARTFVASVTSAAASIALSLFLSAVVIIAPEPTLLTSDNTVTLEVVYTPLVTVPALPVTEPVIVLLKVFVPATVWFTAVVITAPAAVTLVASVTSADVSIPVSFVLSAAVIMAPEPTLLTSERSVTLEVVYIPLVTVVAVVAFPVTFPSKFAFKVALVPVNTLLVSVAAVSMANLPSLSS